MIGKAKDDVLEAALAWFAEIQRRPRDTPLSEAEERLRIAVFLYRKTRSVSGQFSLEEARAQMAKEPEKK